MYATHRPLLDALQARGIDAHLLQEAADEAQRSLRSVRDVLINDSIVTELELTEASADASGLKSVDLVGYPLDAAAMKAIPISTVVRHRVLGIGMDSGTLTVAISDPDDVFALDDVRAATGLAIEPVVAARSELRKLIDRLKREETDLAELASTLGAEVAQAEVQVSEDDAPVVRYVNSLIDQAIQSRASDLHLEPTESDVRVRFRIDGVLHEVDRVPTAVQSSLISRLKIMASVDITERRVPQNGRITVRLDANKVDLRLATLPTVWGEKIVLRVLDTGGIDLQLRRLGFTDRSYERFSASFTKPHGMVLVTGPTGSGKSTTLYATLSEISKPEVNIITVEDPVEYRLPGVNQVQVNNKAGLNFAAVLPAILRSDPDVVLIGEIRDRATAQLGIEAALTGHLVLSTLHTNDAPSAPTRLIEMGVEPFLVGSSLDCVMAQRLARRLCDWCKEPYVPSPSEFDGRAWPAHVEMPEKLWRAIGCRSCGNTGYRGRLAVNEVMPVSEEIERLAVQHATATEIKRVAVAEGMVTLREDGLMKAIAGETTVAEIFRVTV
ncbi:GspE/PulE family protein [uncultured Jatrophihabitans sp.]|uniref:GspE/PulE family protein n=1 Tax=uncultured Jatrophihabitans sp. TaxID=1610747 RepID=UPI0035CA37F5